MRVFSLAAQGFAVASAASFPAVLSAISLKRHDVFVLLALSASSSTPPMG